MGREEMAAGAQGSNEHQRERGGADMTEANKGVRRSTFAVLKMDCPAEENLIRMALGELGEVLSLAFDLSGRRLTVVHRGEGAAVLRRLEPLGLGTSLLTSEGVAETADAATDPLEDAAEAKTLKILLAINGGMFVVEMAAGLAAQSTGLIADSLDMFADAAVYGVALFAVGGAARLKVRAARFAGWLQLALALGVLAEVVRRFIYGSEPVSTMMMGMGLVALAANVFSLVLIARKRDRGAHMQASYIFSANDVIANLGVIAASGLVAWSGSPIPDLVVGMGIGLIVLHGARRILRLKCP